MKKIIKKHISSIITIVYCIIFYFIFTNIAKYHEAWADEAQAWLIAKNTTFFGLIDAMKYEGSPFLWHLILKVVIACGLSYENLYYIPLFFTIIGIIFLFKNKKVPWVFKLILPFTYFIFFQYTVVARSYCLLFPLLMMIAYIYDEKENKLVIYAILLTLLMNVSLHGAVIAGGLWLEFIYNVFKKYNKNQKITKSEIVFISIMFILFIILLILIFPKTDCTYNPPIRYNFFELFGEITYTSDDNLVLNIIATLFFIVILLSTVNEENCFRTNMIFGLVAVLNIGIICSPWHLGTLYLTILFLLIINDSFKNKKIYILFLISAIIQIYWTCESVQYDIYYKYSSGKEVSEYLKTIDYKNKKISAVGFHCVSINPYFEENIFDNYTYAFYEWSKDEKEKTNTEFVLKDLQENNTDIYIIPDYFETESIDKLKDILEKMGYTKKGFNSFMIVKDYLFEKTGFYVFEKIGE